MRHTDVLVGIALVFELSEALLDETLAGITSLQSEISTEDKIRNIIGATELRTILIDLDKSEELLVVIATIGERPVVIEALLHTTVIA